MFEKSRTAFFMICSTLASCQTTSRSNSLSDTEGTDLWQIQMLDQILNSVGDVPADFVRSENETTCQQVNGILSYRSFLIGDKWTLEFSSRENGRYAERVHNLSRIESGLAVGLFEESRVPKTLIRNVNGRSSFRAALNFTKITCPGQSNDWVLTPESPGNEEAIGVKYQYEYNSHSRNRRNQISKSTESCGVTSKNVHILCDTGLMCLRDLRTFISETDPGGMCEKFVSQKPSTQFRAKLGEFCGFGVAGIEIKCEEKLICAPELPRSPDRGGTCKSAN